MKKIISITLIIITAFSASIGLLHSTGYNLDNAFYYRMKPIYSKGDPIPKKDKIKSNNNLKISSKRNKLKPINITPKTIVASKRVPRSRYVITYKYGIESNKNYNLAYRAPLKNNGPVLFRTKKEKYKPSSLRSSYPVRKHILSLR